MSWLSPASRTPTGAQQFEQQQSFMAAAKQPWAGPAPPRTMSPPSAPQLISPMQQRPVQGTPLLTKIVTTSLFPVNTCFALQPPSNFMLRFPFRGPLAPALFADPGCF